MTDHIDAPICDLRLTCVSRPEASQNAALRHGPLNAGEVTFAPSPQDFEETSYLIEVEPLGLQRFRVIAVHKSPA